MREVRLEDLTYCPTCGTVFHVSTLQVGCSRTGGPDYLLAQPCPACGAQLQDTMDAYTEAMQHVAEMAVPHPEDDQ